MILLAKTGLFYGWIKYSNWWSLIIGIDGILIGAIGGVYYGKGVFKNNLNNVSIFTISLITLILSYILFNNILGVNQKYMNKTIGAFFLLTFLIINLKAENNVIGLFLSTKPMVHIGVLSYSIYIWQQIYTAPNNEVMLSVYGKTISQYFFDVLGYFKFPLNLLFLYLTALLSYYGYEKYFLKLKGKFN